MKELRVYELSKSKCERAYANNFLPQFASTAN